MGSLLLISTMKVLLISFLALLPLGLATVCDEHCDACDGDADIAVIKCTESGCEVESKIPDGQDGFINLDYLKGEPDNKIEDLTPEICRAKCQEQSDHDDVDVDGNDKDCIFFHWQEEHVQNEDKKRCSLQTTCPPRSTCDPIAKHCTSGQLGCSDDCQEMSPCSLTQAAWSHDKFHVFCTDPRGADINIYVDDVKDKNIANGTICQTVRKCSAWDGSATKEERGNNQYDRKLAVFCDGTNIEQEGKGTWTVMPDTGDQTLSQAMITDNPGTITEQECLATCDDITLTTYVDQWWTDLICENPLVDNVLHAPNHCVLLCDNHLEKTIDCEYDAEGDRKWRDEDGNELKETDIACN